MSIEIKNVWVVECDYPDCDAKTTIHGRSRWLNTAFVLELSDWQQVSDNYHLCPEHRRDNEPVKS